MKVYVYDHSFEISEANICEARGKYLVRNAMANADKFIKNECLKCRSIPEMLKKVPQITGSLILNITRHMLYTLQLEGVSTNAKDYIDSTFNAVGGSVSQKVCQTLSSRLGELSNASVEQLNEIPDKLTAAAVMDLQNLWIGYFLAHGYTQQNEFYTHQKFHRAMQGIYSLSDSTPMVSAIKICIQSLQDAPYEEAFFDIIESRIGTDKNLIL